MKIAKSKLTLILSVLVLASLQGCHWGWWGWGWGWGYGGGHWSHRGGGHHGGHHILSEDSGVVSEIDSEAHSAQQLARDYNISEIAATRIVGLVNAKDQDQVLIHMGVNMKDIVSMSNLEMPSSEGVQRLALSLGEDPSKIEQLVSRLINDVRDQRP